MKDRKKISKGEARFNEIKSSYLAVYLVCNGKIANVRYDRGFVYVSNYFSPAYSKVRIAEFERMFEVLTVRSKE